MREKRLKNTEWIVGIISLVLLAIGLVALYSATQSTELNEFKKQIQWFLISIPFIIAVYIIDYRLIVKLSPAIYIVFMVLLVGVLFTEPISGASSWYQIGDFLSFQPSELGKIFVIMFAALVLYKLQLKGKREINKPWKLLIYFIAWAIPIGLIILQPDYGTASAYIFAMLFMLFVSGLDKKYIIFACRPPPPLFAAPLPAFLAKAKRRRCSAPLFPRTGGAPFFTCRTSLWKSSSLPLPWRSFCSAQICSARLCSAPAWPADFARCCFSSLFSFTIDRTVRVFRQILASPCTAGTPATPLW